MSTSFVLGAAASGVACGRSKLTPPTLRQGGREEEPGHQGQHHEGARERQQSRLEAPTCPVVAHPIRLEGHWATHRKFVGSGA